MKLTPSQIKFLIGIATGMTFSIPLLLLPASAGLRDMLNNAAWAVEDVTAPAMGKPLPVPQDTPPIGRSEPASIAPCAAPPPTMAAVPVPDEMPTSLGKVQPTVNASIPVGYRDMKTKILMNTAPGNKMRSLLNRVVYPDRFDDQLDYYQTDDGTIAVRSDRASDRVASIQFVQ